MSLESAKLLEAIIENAIDGIITTDNRGFDRVYQSGSTRVVWLYS